MIFFKVDILTVFLKKAGNEMGGWGGGRHLWMRDGAEVGVGWLEASVALRRFRTEVQIFLFRTDTSKHFVGKSSACTYVGKSSSR